MGVSGAHDAHRSLSYVLFDLRVQLLAYPHEQQRQQPTHQRQPRRDYTIDNGEAPTPSEHGQHIEDEDLGVMQKRDRAIGNMLLI